MVEAHVADVLHVVARALPFTTVTCHPSAATTWYSEVIALALQGADPLAPWRTALSGQMERRHAAAVPPHVPAAFVLQWWCEVAAMPIAYAAVLGPWLLRVRTDALGYELAPGLNPHRIVVDPSGAEVAESPEPRHRLEEAHAAYAGLVHDVVVGFAPEVRMGSRQRWGVVDDVWVSAVRLARGAAGETTGPEPRRTSCCFIYALPGMQECSACPRGGVPVRGRN